MYTFKIVRHICQSKINMNRQKSARTLAKGKFIIKKCPMNLLWHIVFKNKTIWSNIKHSTNSYLQQENKNCNTRKMAVILLKTANYNQSVIIQAVYLQVYREDIISNSSFSQRCSVIIFFRIFPTYVCE